MSDNKPQQNSNPEYSNAENSVMQAEPIHNLSAYSSDMVTTAEDSVTGSTSLISWPIQKFAQSVEWCFGVVSMVSLLTLCAAIPILQFITLGYFLEISSRIVKARKVRAGFVGIRKAARIGGFLVGTSIVWTPVFNVVGIFNDAIILLTDSEEVRPFGINLTILILLTIGYTLWAWIRGGRLRHFIWPAPVRFFKTVWKKETYTETITGFWDFVAALRLRELFLQGFYAFLGTAAWLLVPVLLCIGGTQLPEGLRGLSSLIGLPLLALVLIYLPIMQTRYSVQREASVFLDVRAIRTLFKRAPIALWISMVSVWAFALPVYLAKIQLTPREVFLLPTMVFVLFSWPSRMLMGWAYGRANKREENRNVISIWLARLAIIPVVSIYAGVVFLSRYTSWYGDWSLFEQHALLIPIPLLGG